MRHRTRIALAAVITTTLTLLSATGVPAGADELVARSEDQSPLDELDFGTVCRGESETIEFGLSMTRASATAALFGGLTYLVDALGFSGSPPPAWDSSMAAPLGAEADIPSNWRDEDDGRTLALGPASLTVVGEQLGPWSGTAAWLVHRLDHPNPTIQLRYLVLQLPVTMDVVDCSLETSELLPPVRTGEGVVNVVKAGSVVPLKLSVNRGEQAVTDPAELDPALEVTPYRCDGTDEASAVTETASSATALTYVDGHFVQHWRVPNTKGCHRLRLTVAPGVEPVEAQFQIR